METIESLKADLERASGYIICAFCAKEYPKAQTVEETAVKMASHMAECEKHPMRAAIIENIKLRTALLHMQATLEKCEILLVGLNDSDDLGDFYADRVCTELSYVQKALAKARGTKQ